MKRLFLFVLLLSIQSMGFSQDLTIDIPENRFRIDPYNNIIVVQRQDLTEFEDLSAYTEVDLQLDNFYFVFNEAPTGLSYLDSYTVNDGTDAYQLFFSRLPLIKIQSNGPFTNPSAFYYSDEDQILIDSVGVNTFNTYLSSYPKKSYVISFWNNTIDQTPVDVSFAGIPQTNKWVLTSMYNDPLRIRTINTHKLWLSIHQPSYQLQEPNARSGSDGKYVEVFVNGHYSGIYMLSQNIDSDLLALQPYDGHIKGELYNGKEAAAATLFTGLPEFSDTVRYWAGYTMNYPAESDTTNWQNVYDFTDFVLNSDSLDFENIWTKFDYQNYLDYFIFLNLTRTADNTGKNIYLAKYDSASTYFYVPDQLNGSFGIKWNGTMFDITDDILTNGFMDRVIENDVNTYTADVEARWAELRIGPLQLDSIINRFTDSYNLLKANNVYARETLVYPNYPFDEASFDYTIDWIQQRIIFLDIYFNYSPNGVSEIAKTHYLIYPNPANTRFHIQSAEDLTNAYFQILDIQGKVVKSGTYNSKSITVSDIDKGFYLIKINNLSEKIIIR